MLDGGKFCGLSDVSPTVEDNGGYMVTLDQSQYEQFLAYRSRIPSKTDDVFSVTVDASKCPVDITCCSCAQLRNSHV